MSNRALYLDQGPGETRGVVTLDGLPERLLIDRVGELPALKFGARSVARVRKIERAFNSAFLGLPGGGEALLALREDGPRLTEGAAIEIEIRSEPRAGKLAAARYLAEGEGDPRLIEPGPPMDRQLQAFAPEAAILRGRPARNAADMAVDAALAIVHPLPSGGSIAIEPTRALTAVDVDLGHTGGEAKKAARRANLEALASGARLLRLKGFGGLAVFDLVGKGHDGAALLNAARIAFGPDNPGVAIGPVGRFGTMEVSLPRRRAPLVLSGVAADAARLMRMLEREARADPGGRFEALCDPETARAAGELIGGLNARFGGRLSLRAQPGQALAEVRPQ